MTTNWSMDAVSTMIKRAEALGISGVAKVLEADISYKPQDPHYDEYFRVARADAHYNEGDDLIAVGTAIGNMVTAIRNDAIDQLEQSEFVVETGKRVVCIAFCGNGTEEQNSAVAQAGLDKLKKWLPQLAPG